MQGQEPVGGKEALPADSPGQGLVIRFQALIEHGSKVSVCTWEALPVSREMGRKAENQVPKTHGVSCNPETLQFTKGQILAQRKLSFIHLFNKNVFSQGLPWARYCLRYRESNAMQV